MAANPPSRHRERSRNRPGTGRATTRGMIKPRTLGSRIGASGGTPTKRAHAISTGIRPSGEPPSATREPAEAVRTGTHHGSARRNTSTARAPNHKMASQVDAKRSDTRAAGNSAPPRPTHPRSGKPRRIAAPRRSTTDTPDPAGPADPRTEPDRRRPPDARGGPLEEVRPDTQPAT